MSTSENDILGEKGQPSTTQESRLAQDGVSYETGHGGQHSYGGEKSSGLAGPASGHLAG